MTDNTTGHVPETRVEAFLREHPELELETPGYGPVGWYQIVADALLAIVELARSTGTKIEVGQIKEKFGGLRLYTSIHEPSSTTFEVVAQTPSHVHFRGGALKGGVRERVHQIVDTAAARAAEVCARCGQPSTRIKGFYRLCDEHASAYS